MCPDAPSVRLVGLSVMVRTCRFCGPLLPRHSIDLFSHPVDFNQGRFERRKVIGIIPAFADCCLYPPLNFQHRRFSPVKFGDDGRALG